MHILTLFPSSIHIKRESLGIDTAIPKKSTIYQIINNTHRHQQHPHKTPKCVEKPLSNTHAATMAYRDRTNASRKSVPRLNRWSFQSSSYVGNASRLIGRETVASPRCDRWPGRRTIFHLKRRDEGRVCLGKHWRGFMEFWQENIHLDGGEKGLFMRENCKETETKRIDVCSQPYQSDMIKMKIIEWQDCESSQGREPVYMNNCLPIWWCL